jgi:hypothetical protein
MALTLLYGTNQNLVVDEEREWTASGPGTACENLFYIGATVFVLVRSVAPGASLIAKVQHSPNGADWADIPGASTSGIVAPGTYQLMLRPGLALIANLSVAVPLPRTWRVHYTLTGPVTLSTAVAYSG